MVRDCRSNFDNRGECAFLPLLKEDLQVKKADMMISSVCDDLSSV